MKGDFFMKHRCCSVLILIVFLLFSLNSCAKLYQTSDLSLYNAYPKFYEKNIAELTDLLFPNEIEDYFKNPIYSFRLDKLDGAFEEWLEFRIEDTDQYLKYKEDILLENKTEPFKYDASFEAWTLEDTIYTGGDNEEYLELATILKVLFHDKSQTVIYIALRIEGPMLYHSPAEFIYFQRFSIDISNYPRLYGDSD